MTDDGTSRSVVRKGAVKNTWMVWDRKTHKPVKILHGLATGLKSEWQAREIRDQLILDHERK
jgi:hypothetical protein